MGDSIYRGQALPTLSGNSVTGFGPRRKFVETGRSVSRRPPRGPGDRSDQGERDLLSIGRHGSWDEAGPHKWRGSPRWDQLPGSPSRSGEDDQPDEGSPGRRIFDERTGIVPKSPNPALRTWTVWRPAL